MKIHLYFLRVNIQNHISKLKEVIGIKDNRIANLEKKIEALKDEKKILENTNSKENAQLTALKTQLFSVYLLIYSVQK